VVVIAILYNELQLAVFINDILRCLIDLEEICISKRSSLFIYMGINDVLGSPFIKIYDIWGRYA